MRDALSGRRAAGRERGPGRGSEAFDIADEAAAPAEEGEGGDGRERDTGDGDGGARDSALSLYSDTHDAARLSSLSN